MVAGDTTFRACVPSPPQTERSHSHSHLCAGVHGMQCVSCVDGRGDVLHADSVGSELHGYTCESYG
jgi:hypothetical protein